MSKIVKKDEISPKSDPSDMITVSKKGEMPKLLPGDRNSSIFTGERIEEFLEVYELITATNSHKEKTLLFPFYCSKNIQEGIKKTVSFESRDWESFVSMLKRRFKEHKPDDPLELLKKIVEKGTSAENYLSFLDEFEYETNKLEREGEISPVQKSSFFIKSLPIELVIMKEEQIYSVGKIMSYCQLKDIFKSVCIAKGKLRKLIPSYGGVGKSEIDSGKKKYSDEKIDELIEGMSALTILYKSKIEKLDNANNYSQIQRIGRVTCIYCDGEHLKRECKELDLAIKDGVVKIGDQGMIVTNSGKEIPPNWGKGGMKSLITKEVSSRFVLANIPEEKLPLTTKNEIDSIFESNEVIQEEKFKGIVNNFAAKRNLPTLQTDHDENAKKIKIDQSQGRRNEDIPLAELLSKGKHLSFSESEFEPIINEKPMEKTFDDSPYKMKAKIVKEDLGSIIIKKCKELKIELSLEELATVSPQIRKSLNEEFRIKRVAEVGMIENQRNFNSDEWKKTYLSVGSGRIVGKIQGAEIPILFDEGSEVNLMSYDVFRALESLGRAKINTEIKWKMKDANSGVSELLGVIENCQVEVERCRVLVHIFVSKQIKEAVILGRPWDIKCRVMKDNRADGSLWYTTRDEFNDGVATFCVSNSNDKRRFDKNTEYINNYTVIGSQIQSIQEDDRIINQLNSIDYIANVRTRYKKASEKTKPVAERSINYKTPGIITRHTNDDKSEYRLTEKIFLK
ncbi:hypothetical protein AYI69_g5947 [Smittium culicis]|uniref:Uncharacterized protein n=1 Tax=Smittium culicis TaxID=133412 RepID=A0A1R1Y2V0_9FUNG|nr:hypothetical protein AYI69_g5947 [Smittium culicis]